MRASWRVRQRWASRRLLPSACQAAAAAEQLAGDPDLGRLLPPTELSAETLKPDTRVERAERDQEGRIELE